MNGWLTDGRVPSIILPYLRVRPVKQILVSVQQQPIRDFVRPLLDVGPERCPMVMIAAQRRISGATRLEPDHESRPSSGVQPVVGRRRAARG